VAAEALRITWLDRLLIGIAPEWGLRRVRARATATMMARHYDAAAGGRRTSGWYRSSSDANAANTPSLTALRELSRDLRRNNGWARRGIQAITNNTVGWGIEAKPTAASEGLASEALAVWKAWANSTACDYDGRLTFVGGLQRLVMATVVESGEALVVRERASSADGLPVPLRIRVLEPDHLDLAKDGIMGTAGGPIVQGVELDGRGRRVAYWLFEQHPGATRVFGNRFESKRVPAADIVHVYDVARAGQMRGVPWLSAAVAKLNDFDDYDDARLMQAKIAACFGAFVTDLDAAPTAVGEQSEDDDRLETLEPGHISYLSPGKSVTFAQPPSTTDHASFSSTALRRIAASIGGVPYEEMTGDYSQVNFSSARMARLAFYANVHAWRWDMLVPQLCGPVWRWVMELAAGLNGWPGVPGAEWSPPPMPMLEPDKEGLAYTRMIRSGVMTYPEVLREQGKDPAAHMAEIAASNKKLDELGVVLDSDPRRTTVNGQGQPGVVPVVDAESEEETTEEA
jgi:lambda family phage portal protein